jgi:hypothetical protein
MSSVDVSVELPSGDVLSAPYDLDADVGVLSVDVGRELSLPAARAASIIAFRRRGDGPPSPLPPTLLLREAADPDGVVRVVAELRPGAVGRAPAAGASPPSTPAAPTLPSPPLPPPARSPTAALAVRVETAASALADALAEAAGDADVAASSAALPDSEDAGVPSRNLSDVFEAVSPPGVGGAISRADVPPPTPPPASVAASSYSSPRRSPPSGGRRGATSFLGMLVSSSATRPLASTGGLTALSPAAIASLSPTSATAAGGDEFEYDEGLEDGGRSEAARRRDSLASPRPALSPLSSSSSLLPKPAATPAAASAASAASAARARALLLSTFSRKFEVLAASGFVGTADFLAACDDVLARKEDDEGGGQGAAAGEGGSPSRPVPTDEERRLLAAAASAVRRLRGLEDQVASRRRRRSASSSSSTPAPVQDASFAAVEASTRPEPLPAAVAATAVAATLDASFAAVDAPLDTVAEGGTEGGKEEEEGEATPTDEGDSGPSPSVPVAAPADLLAAPAPSPPVEVASPLARAAGELADALEAAVAAAAAVTPTLLTPGARAKRLGALISARARILSAHGFADAQAFETARAEASSSSASSGGGGDLAALAAVARLDAAQHGVDVLLRALDAELLGQRGPVDDAPLPRGARRLRPGDLAPELDLACVDSHLFSNEGVVVGGRGSSGRARLSHTTARAAHPSPSSFASSSTVLVFTRHFG